MAWNARYLAVLQRYLFDSFTRSSSLDIWTCLTVGMSIFVALLPRCLMCSTQKISCSEWERKGDIHVGGLYFVTKHSHHKYVTQKYSCFTNSYPVSCLDPDASCHKINGKSFLAKKYIYLYWHFFTCSFVCNVSDHYYSCFNNDHLLLKIWSLSLLECSSRILLN